MKSQDSKPNPEPLEVAASRRDVVKATAWIVPAVVTLTVTPSFAGVGSGVNVTRPQQLP